jgi:E3 ubiquitin-protein ligase HUWE1
MSDFQWLWMSMEHWDLEKLSKFLSFVTGCASLPIDGLRPPLTFTLMQIDNGDPGEESDRINVEKDNPDRVLPRAHTCFNQLVLPPYSNATIQEERILYALFNTEQGFFMS